MAIVDLGYLSTEAFPVAFGTFPPDVQLDDDLFTHRTDLRSTMDEHGRFMPMHLSEVS